jgi:replicative DNA helicase
MIVPLFLLLSYARARRVARDHGGKMGLIMVDYLQLMRVPGFDNNRVNEVGEISRSLKALAKELDCPVVALSQLSRNVENAPINDLLCQTYGNRARLSKTLI